MKFDRTVTPVQSIRPKAHAQAAIDFRPLRLAKKIAAGAQFAQTQYCFDLPRLKSFMAKVCDMGLDKKCFILVGVGPLASAKTARWMRANVAGVNIPDEVVARLEGAKDQRAEGKRMCIETIQQLREIKGVAGVHVMAYRQEQYVSEIVHESGVLKGRAPWRRDFTPKLQASESLEAGA